MRISDWSSDVCSSDLRRRQLPGRLCDDRGAADGRRAAGGPYRGTQAQPRRARPPARLRRRDDEDRQGAQSGHPARRFFRGKRGEGGAAVRRGDRKSVVEGKSVYVRVDLGGRRIINKQTNNHHLSMQTNTKPQQNKTKM